jgi:hypothetical protein
LNMNNFPNGADLAFKYIRPSAQQQQQQWAQAPAIITFASSSKVEKVY